MVNVLVVFAICLLAIYYHPERLHIQIGQIEIDLDDGFLKPRLALFKARSI